jgi:periplasmic protein TonB
VPSLAEPLPSPPRLARRRTDAAQGQVPRDRLATMLMLAGLLHGLIILGITFTPGKLTGGGTDRGIEVLLVSDELAEAEKNDSATYLSQRTQLGSGNSKDKLAARIPSRAQAAADGEAAPAGDTVAEQVLATSRMSPIEVLALPAETDSAGHRQKSQYQAAGDDELRLRGDRRDELYISADTRASRLAPYLASWKRRVERVGTVNYPSAAQRKGFRGNPVVEVALGRDGRLESAHILHSSGQPEIDAAALGILRLASPFDPFPPDLARDYRVLRFAYEWQFVGGEIAETAIQVP